MSVAIIINTVNGDRLLRGSDSCWEYCEQVKVKKEGDVVLEWRPYKYWATLSAALQTIMNEKVRNSDATTLEELQKVIKETRDEFTRMYHDCFVLDTSAVDAQPKCGWKQIGLPMDGAGEGGDEERGESDTCEEPVTNKTKGKKVVRKP